MKYYAKKLLLTHDGTVKIVVQQKDVEFNIDPLKFVESMTKYGDYRDVGLPVPEDCLDHWYKDSPKVHVSTFIGKFFPKCEGIDSPDYDSIESEEISGYKFVVTDRKSGVQSMWVNVDTGTAVAASAPKKQ